MSKFMLEYQLPDRPDGPVTLHANQQNADGTFDAPLNSNGYLPLALFDRKARSAEQYRILCDWLYDRKPDYETAKSWAAAVSEALTPSLNPVR